MQPVEEYVKKARSAGKPYFLWYAPMLPHTPHNPPERLLSKYKAHAPTESIAKYWAMCEWFDETIGQLREIVNKHGRPDNTLIVYVTDNGWINLPNESAYAPRSKRSQYEGGIRTPIMFCWPGHVTPAATMSIWFPASTWYPPPWPCSSNRNQPSCPGSTCSMTETQ